jgi:advillin
MSVTRVVDGGETSLFKQYFISWKDRHEKEESEEEEGKNVAEHDYSGSEGIDLDDLHKRKSGKLEEWMPDDGSGKLELWAVHENDLLELPEKARGIFFAGDCYIFKYTYGVPGQEQYIIYFWQGSEATTDVRTACAGLVVSMDNQLGGQAIQMRVVMNKEPKHFMKLFKGKIIVFSEGHITGFKSVHDRDNFNPNEACLFQIRGTSDDETKAIQVTARAASLNSNDMFVLDTPKKTFAWAGKYCSDQEKEMARHMGQYLSDDKEVIVMKEGEEPQQFWNAIGGEEEYYTGQRTKETKLDVCPRLFHCSDSSGRFSVEEIVDFHQDDLEEDDVMILDTYDEIFVWLGEGCREFEKKEAAKTAYKYLDSDPTGRNPENTMIIVVRMGFEPPQFTGCFLGWNPNKWADGKSFKELMDEIGQENAGISLLKDEYKKYTSFYPLDQLQENPPPEGVDVTKKEMYLSDEDFKEVFGMTKDEYMKYPEWKRISMKKEHDLF